MMYVDEPRQEGVSCRQRLTGNVEEVQWEGIINLRDNGGDTCCFMLKNVFSNLLYLNI